MEQKPKNKMAPKPDSKDPRWRELGGLSPTPKEPETNGKQDKDPRPDSN